MTASAEPPKAPPPAGSYSRLRPSTHSTSSQLENSSYTVDTAIDTIGLGPFQYIVLILAGLCWTAESMEMLLLSFIKQPLQCEWDISDSSAALITTCVAAGMLAGSTTWGIVADRFGRRFSFITSTAFTFSLGLVSALSINYPMMLVSRGLVGFGIGGVPVSFSLLMEFLPSANRGSWGMSLALFWALGAVFESIVAMFVLPVLGWRWLIAISTLPLLIVLLSSFWLSESPRWLISRGKVDWAEQILIRVARINRSSLPSGNLARETTTYGLVEEDPQSATLRTEIDDAFNSTDALVPVGSSAVLCSTAPSASAARNVDVDVDVEAVAGPEHSDAPASAPPFSPPVNDSVPNPAATEPLSSQRNVGISSLLRRGARSLALTVGLIWFVCAFVYYGLVMLQPELISAENAGHRCNYAASECGVAGGNSACTILPICSWTSDKTCVPTGLLHARAEGAENASGQKNATCARQLTRDDFASTLWASVGEMPGVLIAFMMVDIIGRRPLLGYMFGALGLSFIALFYCLSRMGETAIFFIARGAASGAFQAMFLFTNEVYPAVIRATAMGVSSSVARLGLIVTPFIAQYLTNIDERMALVVYSAASVLAVLGVVWLPIETTGRPLVESMEELVQSLREARMRQMGVEVGTSFAKDPTVNPVVRFLRWNAVLDGVTVR